MRTNDQIIKQILNKRGITDGEEIAEFLSPNPTLTYDPFLLDGMQAGVDLLLSVAESGGRICIYGDYDADGVTAVTVMACGISRVTDNWFYYIPSRFDEGYGLNMQAIDRIKEQKADLIITVDCGCVSEKEVEYAKSEGISVIVTDHHNIEDVISDCIVIDPKKPSRFMSEPGSEPYPCVHLAGCGVAFKFIQAMQRKKGLPKSMLNDALDMVAVGTVGDIVPLVDENRTLVKYGIAVANTGRRKALAKLASAISINNINSESIAYGIVPHINATGRMSSAMEAAELFNSDSDIVIENKIDELIRCNSERKRIQEKAYESCLSMINEDDLFIVLNVPEMHEGIAGIVAGKLKDRFNRSVIIVTPSQGGYLKGTGRSISKIDIYDVLNRNSELFERFGGHRSACGFLMKKDNLERLVVAVNSYVAELHRKDPDLFTETVEYDIELQPEEVTVALAKGLTMLAPFGEGNPNPRFVIKDAVLTGLSYMGETRNHARFSVYRNRFYVNCVLFRTAQDNREILEDGKPHDLIGTLSYQVWKGQERVQFIVEAIN